MGDIAYRSIQDIRSDITSSNRSSNDGSPRYIFWENKAVQSDYDFIDCQCAADCWCRSHGCTGHYRIKEIGFDQFLETYVHLWVPPRARDNVKNAVLHGQAFNGWQRNAIRPLQWLMRNWDGTLHQVRSHNKCGLCDNGVPPGNFADNLYKAKIWSQLYYDSLVPFDTKSRTKIMESGYTDPKEYFTGMNRELFRDLRQVASRESLDVMGLRNLDEPWTIAPDLVRIENGQPLSRVLDKVFYSP